MARARHPRPHASRLLVPTIAVVAAVAAGWIIEPSGIQADQTDRRFVVREPLEHPAIRDRAITTEPSPVTAMRSGVPHAIVVDSDLDVEVDHATGLGH